MGGAVFAVGKLAFAAIGVAVGWKLAAEIRRGEVPGLHRLALLAIVLGGLGLAAMPAADALEAPWLSLGGELLVRSAMLLLCVFIARTFRPDPIGYGAAGLCAALLVATLCWDVTAQPSLVRYDYALPSSLANQVAVAAPFLWSAIESWVLWRRARRRVSVGLAEPEIAQRFLLWTLTTACFVGITLLAIAAGLAPGIAELAHALRGLLYLAITGLVWSAMFDPRTEPAGASAAETSR